MMANVGGHDKSMNQAEDTRTYKMTRRQRNILQEFKPEYKDLNPFIITKRLVKQRSVERHILDWVVLSRKCGITEEGICTLLFSIIPLHCRFEDLIGALRSIGYGKMLHTIICNLQEKHNEMQIYKMHKTECSHRGDFYRSLINIKQIIHGSALTNPDCRMLYLSQKYKQKLILEEDHIRSQDLADMCVIFFDARLDLKEIMMESEHVEFRITESTKVQISEIFEEFKKIIDKTPNPVVTRILYYSRLAHALTMAGHLQDGKDKMKEALSLAEQCMPCLEIANLFYLDAYQKLWEYEIYPSKSIQESCLNSCQIGLRMLEQETDEDIKRQWQRMFIIRMVFCYLGICNRGNIINGYYVNQENASEAKSLLQKFKQLFGGIEKKREMLYYLANARVHELEKKFDVATEYAQMANDLAIQGKFMEQYFIDVYIDRLHMLNKEVSSV